jgi:hypothetical protein
MLLAGIMSLQQASLTPIETNATTDAVELRGASQAIQSNPHREVILSGPARSSKTFGILYKFHHACEQTPGLRCLFIRATRESMTDSVLATFEKDVVPPLHHILLTGGQRHSRHSYRYLNGSEIVCMGFRQSGKDQTEKIMSTEWDLIYVNETPELIESQWEKLTSRLSRFTLGYAQLVGDMNPPPASHWTWKRERDSKLEILASQLIDNPRWWQDGAWTAEGQQVYDTLNALSGPLRDRLFLGKPASYEGLVYGNFGLDNITDQEPDPDLLYGLAVDDGYIDPRAILFIQRTPTHLLVFDELYHRKHLEETCLKETIEVCGLHFKWLYYDPDGNERDALPAEVDPANVVTLVSPDIDPPDLTGRWRRKPKRLPEIAIVSHEAPALHARFRHANIPARVGVHPIIQGIPIVRQLICDGNDHRTLLVHRRCVNLIEEITSGYKFPPDTVTRRNEEMPVDENNHALDALRTFVWMRLRTR